MKGKRNGHTPKYDTAARVTETYSKTKEETMRARYHTHNKNISSQNEETTAT